ncbi:glutathione S-transferase family protein [Undibacterium luofuense]|uniref:glutathione S-transferase family protein n=1 Tax=Undibacterium luofuense TaxID=2828733 RepID=UPI0030EC66FA
MYTLYYAPNTASMVVHLALLEAQAAYQLEKVDFSIRAQKDPAYLALNPQGVVPTLVHEGVAYQETPAILMLLAEHFPDAGLMPAAGSVAHARCREWLFYLSHNLHATYRLWFYPETLGFSDYPSGLKEDLQTRMAGFWDFLEAHLQKSGPYLCGDQLSLADFYLTVLMRWSRHMPRPATGWPALQQLAARVAQRPSWQLMCERESPEPWHPGAPA